MGLRLSVEKTRICRIDEGSTSSAGASSAETGEGEPARKRCTPYRRRSRRLFVAKGRSLTCCAKHRMLADALRRLNPTLRGWCNYSGRACPRERSLPRSLRLWRTVGWLRKRHVGLNMHTLVRRYLPGWQIRVAEIEMSDRKPSSSSATAAGAPGSRPHGQWRRLRHRLHERRERVESGMRWKCTCGSEGGPGNPPVETLRGRPVRPLHLLPDVRGLGLVLDALEMEMEMEMEMTPDRTPPP